MLSRQIAILNNTGMSDESKPLPTPNNNNHPSTMSVTQIQLQEIFDYREDGNLVHKRTRTGCIEGTLVGSLNKCGYYYASVLGKKYKLHRLIFLYHKGYLPKYVDHINCIKADNRIENLRPATNTLNQLNSAKDIANTSGTKGLHYSNCVGKWIARITIEGKRYEKTIKADKDSKEARELLEEWLVTKRTEICGEFTHHG